jgi:hypothetical protein
MAVTTQKARFFRHSCFVLFQIFITKQYLELEPIGVLFIIFFGIILIIQFIAMLFHRFGTLSHMLSTTQISWFKSGAQVPLKTSLSNIAYLGFDL